MSQLSTETKLKRMNLNIDAQLHQKFKVAAVMQGKNMSDVLLEFIQEYVQKHYPKVVSGRKEGRG